MVLPRFKLEQNYDLIENLQEMGLTDLFRQSGDFSEMASEKVLINQVRKENQRRPAAQASSNASGVLILLILLSDSHAQLKHQGTITVNEEGTEAAALTQMGFMPLSSQMRFTVDHPFLFLVYEHRTDCLLFVGRVVNPALH